MQDEGKLPTLGPCVPHKVLPCRQPRSQAEREKGLAFLHPVSLFKFSNLVNSFFLGGGLSEVKVRWDEEGQVYGIHEGPSREREA